MGFQSAINKMIKNAVSAKPQISQSELQNLQLRNMLLQGKDLEIMVIRNEYKQYVNLLLSKYEMDKDKDYNINLETGEIIEKTNAYGQSVPKNLADNQRKK